MLGLFVDIRNELADVEQEAGLLLDGIAIVNTMADEQDRALDWLLVQGLASGIEKIYSGCERILSRIATEYDGSRIEHHEGWHSALLKRMANPYPGLRNAVISDETYLALNRIRAFRHRERNVYGHELDRELTLKQARDALPAFAALKQDIEAFAELHAGQ